MAMMQNSMFGPSVEDIRAQIEAENRTQFSDPTTNAVANLVRSGITNIGEAFGAGDPRIKKAKKMEEVKRYVQENVKSNDMTEYYTKLAEAFKKFGMIEEAFNVEKVLEQLKDKDLDRQLKKEDLAGKREDRQLKLNMMQLRLQGKPFAEQAAKLLESGKYTPESVEAYASSGKASDLKFKPDKEKDKWSEPYTISGPSGPLLVKKNEVTGEVKVVDTAPKVTVKNAPPGFTLNMEAGDKTAQAQASITKRLEPYGKRINEILSLKDLINSADDNPKAAAAALSQFARTFRSDSQVAASEVKRMIESGALTQRVAQMITGFFTGTLIPSNKKDMLDLIDGILKMEHQKFNSIRDNQRTLMSKIKDKEGKPIYSEDDLNLIFSLPEFQDFTNKTGGDSSGLSPAGQSAYEKYRKR